ncbi:response regulator [Pseudobacteriovorax antillogorgiicola]|uniref:Response regulator receiver domain-containing protein n=1 Tax=Pseudobacteriovorax antillogorgiicola TaxID=1513793 RepID=A0A1Y6CAD4_9BACT|nr:response regulator [Pseudobacteriovorax antillogorgiicola]TCS49008.1 response regulator receiver domain-containing protein [Pseudobacteriovorax antillogorgiicola]SMF53164.1 Response regulator receiver domain-containing protein [Pseudobacteriovorax antillogorgiicola]
MESDKQMKILYLDDDPDQLEFAVEMLAEHARVTTARNPKEALEQLREETFDLLVTDIIMPGSCGIDFAKKVQVDYPELPMVAVSGAGLQCRQQLSQELQAVFMDFLEKPNTWTELRQRWL